MKKILVLNFFPAFVPASSGGELRYFNMYKNLSDYADITLLSPTYNDQKVEIVEHSSTFREYRIPKEDIHNELHWKLEQENFSPEFSALTCAYSGEHLNKYHYYYLKLYTDVDIIVHDFPYMLNYDLFFSIDNKPRIYNSHNLEHELLKQIYYGFNSEKHLEYIFELEKKLVLGAELVFSTSNIEKIKFQDLYGVNPLKVKLAPNGINPEDFLKRDKKIKNKTAFFIGSGHPPNIESVKFIVDHLADKCPKITFLIAGTCCKGINSKKSNVHLLGKVDDNEKNSLFKTSDIAINPMFTGAGTNLKTLEYLSMGIPMVSTDVGVRGINLKDSEHFIIADKECFSEKLNALVNDIATKEKISIKSKQYINENFNWKTIAENVYDEIKSIKVDTKRTLLLLNDFEVSAPFGGGEIRINKLYSKLSNSYNVLLLCLNSNNNINKNWITESFLEISFPKTKEHLEEETKINSQYWISATDIVNSYMVTKNELYMHAVKGIAQTFDVTVLCHPYMYESIEGLQYKYLIHESLNHELTLKKELLLNHPDSERLIAQTEKVESSSCINSNFIVSVSDSDHKNLTAYDQLKIHNINTISNGVEIVKDSIFETDFTKIKNIFNGYTTILFIGSAHMPNIESAKYILNSLAIELADCYFIIIGSVCNALINEIIPANVLLFGRLDNDYKNVLCSISDIAINPMFGGSGSNLKLAEYFAWKLPAVTTPFGARGYKITNNKEAIICDIKEFANNVKLLQNDFNLYRELSSKSFDYVNSNVEWSVLGKKFKNLLDFKVYGIKRKNLLIVTYRFTIPPLGGAELYMLELIKGLNQLNDLDITVAYLDSYNIENQYHFSINATHNNGHVKHEYGNVTFKKFKYNELKEIDKLDNSRLLMKNWLTEFINSARKFLHYYHKSMLLGGWNFPEKHTSTTQIWSSSISEIYLVNVKKLFLKAYSPIKKNVTFSMSEKTVEKICTNGSFEIEITIPNDGILRIECSEEYVTEDVRPLGILINSIFCNGTELNLAYCYRDFLKEHYLSEYTDELISVAQRRDEHFDSIFERTRGFNSVELETYLDTHIKEFDVILGHSIPFATTPLTAKYALKYNKPYALLPHFHFDDEFYHWNSYYKSMQKADTVFSSPTISIDIFYDKLNIRAVKVPGGGINADEYQSIDSNHFVTLYSSNKPFLLILGRKSGAKNYTSVIEAIDNVNKQEHICNIVMIGRDEDNMTIDSKYTYYLGEQPREVVLSALNECYGLVTMSESESFGIVIIEAWMLKKPVIINEKCPAFVELVEDNINGLHANKINLSDKINILLNDKQLADKLGENGHNFVNNYTWKGISKLINDKLLSLSKKTI